MEIINIKDENGKEYKSYDYTKVEWVEVKPPKYFSDKYNDRDFEFVYDGDTFDFSFNYRDTVICSQKWFNGILSLQMYGFDVKFKVKKKWYEDESNFPALITNGDAVEVATGFNRQSQRFFFRECFYSNICNGWRLATKEELLSLHVEED